MHIPYAFIPLKIQKIMGIKVVGIFVPKSKNYNLILEKYENKQFWCQIWSRY